VEVVASLSQGRTAAAQCGLFTHQSVPVIFEPPCIKRRWIQFWVSILSKCLKSFFLLFLNIPQIFFFIPCVTFW